MREASGVRLEFSGETLEARFLVDHGDLGALVEEVAAKTLANAARGASDGDNLVLENHAMFPKGPCPREVAEIYPFNAPSIRPLKNILCASVNAMMPGVTTIT